MVTTRIGIIEIIETEEIIEVLRETIKIIETSRIMLQQIISQVQRLISVVQTRRRMKRTASLKMVSEVNRAVRARKWLCSRNLRKRSRK